MKTLTEDELIALDDVLIGSTRTLSDGLRCLGLHAYDHNLGEVQEQLDLHQCRYCNWWGRADDFTGEACDTCAEEELDEEDE